VIVVSTKFVYSQTTITTNGGQGDQNPHTKTISSTQCYEWSDEAGAGVHVIRE